MALGLLTTGCAALAADVQRDQLTGPLADYVLQPDPSYGWKQRRELELDGVSLTELTLTSQTWRDIVWRHQLFILRPRHVVDSTRAIFLISGGRWNDELASELADLAAGLPREMPLYQKLAELSGSPVAVLKHVPQQPIFDGKVEDEIISYTFEQYLRTQDATWPLLLPMVKSAVRGMDAVQEFAKLHWDSSIEHFTVTGASKRGWTTWLTSAVDDRVECLAPMVIDVLNMQPQMRHQLETWGTYSEEIADYTDRGLQERTETELGKRLNSIVDPYEYRARITQPKLILLGTNDRYWPVDALNLYWDGLAGEKHVLYVPNRGHDLGDFDRVLSSIAALHLAAAERIILPKFEWTVEPGSDGISLELASDMPAAHMRAWIATSEDKDFRDATWTSKELTTAGLSAQHDEPRPQSGFLAVFGEAVYEHANPPLTYYLSTNLQLVGSDGYVGPRAEPAPAAAAGR